MMTKHITVAILMGLALMAIPFALNAMERPFVIQRDDLSSADTEPKIDWVETSETCRPETCILIFGQGFGNHPKVTLITLEEDWKDILFILPVIDASDTEAEAMLPPFLLDGTYMILVENRESTLSASKDIFLEQGKVTGVFEEEEGVQPAACSIDCAQFVTDVTYPDHAVVNANTAFTKTWRFKNVGTNTWSNYKMYFDSDNQLSGPQYVSVPTTAPGSTVDISVNLKAPASPTCAAKGQKGVWKIKNASGGSVYGGTATVVITVNPTSGSPIPNLASSSYSKSVNPLVAAGYGGQCTALAWGRANEVKGITNLPTGNAKTWVDSTIYAIGDDCYPNSIAGYGGDSKNPNGHVEYVERCDSSNATINEANYSCYYSDSWGGGYDGAPKTLTMSAMKSRSGAGSLLGYIYLEKPSITSLSPSSGSKDTVVTITGVRFGKKQQSSCKVMFGSNAGTITKWDDKQITVKAPTGTAGKTVSVTVTTTAGTSNGVSFKYK